MNTQKIGLSAEDGAIACTGQRFERHSRLLTAADYSTVFSRNRKFSDHYWTVLVHENQEGPARLGLAIAKKRAKRAVDRNRIKRVARETFRCNSVPLNGKELVIMNRDAAVSADNATLRATLQRLFDKVSNHKQR